MIEIVFGEGACGSLKVAQGYGKGKYLGGAVSYSYGIPMEQRLRQKKSRQLSFGQRKKHAGIGKMLFRWIAGETMCIVSTLL